MTEQENNAVVTIDVAAIPKSFKDIDQWLYLWKEHGTIFYDSTEGLAPTVISGKLVQVAIINTSTKEGEEKLKEKLDKIN